MIELNFETEHKIYKILNTIARSISHQNTIVKNSNWFELSEKLSSTMMLSYLEYSAQLKLCNEEAKEGHK